MTDKVIIINKQFNTYVEYTPTHGFWAHYPDTIKIEAVNTILERNRKGESVFSVCKDICEKYARSPHTLAAWFRKMT